MSHGYSENILVQESAGNLLQNELGWHVHFAFNTEVLGENGTFGRKSYHEVLLVRYFRKALHKLNPWLTNTQADEAQRILGSRLSTSSLLQINEEKYKLIRDGIYVTVKHPNGTTEDKKIILIDFQHPEANDFTAIKEMKIHGDIYRRRTDIVGFVNGIPLLFIELKKNTVDVETAYTDNYTDYLDTIPQLFYTNAFLMLSNGTESKVGTLGSKYEFFHEWKRLDEKDKGNVALPTMLRGICKKENFLDLLENFILYDHSNGKTVKILAQNHQYLGVNEAIKNYADRQQKDGKLGVFWHTQGAGKSYSMVFFAQKIRRKFAGSPTFVILTDRDELNKQISDTFENCGLLDGVKASHFIATSSADVITKLSGNPSFVFTLIQKFNQPHVGPLPHTHDIVIMSDEAHRSQYGIFAANMMDMLPDASRIGFTGTPLFSSDDITARTFGGYVSIYDFKRAVEDGATVPLYYENRGEKLEDLKNPEITNEILEAIEQADLDAAQQEKLEAEFAREIHLLTAEPRLRAIAGNFVRHYSNLWTTGKAMFVCLNKVTCVRMYNYVQEYWQQEIKALEAKLKHATQQEAQELERKIQWMKETEMAVVVSQDQNEIQTFLKWHLDIKTHRLKMESRELDKEFKDQQNPFRIVFVCAMWLTGFDVKCLSCLYLDKPLKAHTLMQAIARANRVNEGKSNGLVIDYIGIVKALRKALADYTANPNDGSGGSEPTVDHKELVDKILAAIDKAEKFLRERGFDLQKLMNAVDFDKLDLLLEAADIVCDSPEEKKTFTATASEVLRLKRYANREDITDEMDRKINAIRAIYEELQKKRKHVDTTDLMVAINGIISQHLSIESPGDDQQEDSRRFDISGIDFDLLRREFAKAKHKHLIFKDLEEMIQEKLDAMLLTNPNRIDYYERYQQIIQEYNDEQDRSTIEKTFMDLMALADSLNQEQQRYLREGFTNDEELSIYDLLFKDDLSKNDIRRIKDVAIILLHQIKAKIAELDHWTDKQETKAEVENLIRDTLWSELPESYDENSISEYRQRIYEYVYARYKEVS